MRLDAVFLIAAVVCALSFPSLAQPTFSTNYQSFNVKGLTQVELWKDIQTNGPRSRLGIGSAGYTSFRFDNKVNIVPRNGKCIISSIEFHLTSIVELPNWTDYDAASADLQIYWQALSSDVRRHEDGHVEIAEASISKLYQDLSKITPQRNCDVLKRKVRTIIKRSEVTRNRAQNAFERKEVRGQRKRLTNLVRALKRQQQ